MRCIVKRQVQLFDSVYPVGMRDIPVGHAQGWYWDALVADGSIVVLDKPEAVEFAVEPEVVMDAAEEAVEVVAEEVAEQSEPEEKPRRLRKKD